MIFEWLMWNFVKGIWQKCSWTGLVCWRVFWGRCSLLEGNSCYSPLLYENMHSCTLYGSCSCILPEELLLLPPEISLFFGYRRLPGLRCCFDSKGPIVMVSAYDPERKYSPSIDRKGNLDVKVWSQNSRNWIHCKTS